MRNLSEQEQVANYAKYYKNSATDFSDASSKFPALSISGDLKSGDISIEDYANKKYIKNI